MEIDYKMQIGKRLKFAREKKGLQQKFVAKQMGVVSATLSRIEAGLHEPDSEKLRKMCAMYEVDPSWVLYGVEYTSGGQALTDSELTLLAKFKKMSEVGKQWLLNTLDIVDIK